MKSGQQDSTFYLPTYYTVPMREFKSFDRQVSLPYLTEAINNVAMEAVIAPNRPGLDHEIRVNLRSSQFSTPGALGGGQ